MKFSRRGFWIAITGLGIAAGNAFGLKLQKPVPLLLSREEAWQRYGVCFAVRSVEADLVDVTGLTDTWRHFKVIGLHIHGTNGEYAYYQTSEQLKRID